MDRNLAMAPSWSGWPFLVAVLNDRRRRRRRVFLCRSSDLMNCWLSIPI